MCDDCQRRARTNPLRVFDCKVEADQPIIAKLPTIFDHLDTECRQHFETVTSELKDRGIGFQINPRLVRGLDYYTRTTFEITSGALGAQDALLGGGRYDGLAEMLGGPPTPGIGFAIGQDRLVLAISEYAKVSTAKQPEWMDWPLNVYVAWLGPEAREAALKLARELRGKDLKVAIDYEPAKFKKSLGMANRLQAPFAVIIGETEVASGRYQVKDMTTGGQEEVERTQVLQHLISRLKEKFKTVL
jgi:histidyl-tRNA synthetase